jgi:hypothetical protein
LRVGGQRLLDQYVFALFERRECPFVVQTVGQRDVDGVDVWVGKECVVGSIGFAITWEIRFVGFDLGLSAGEIAGGDAGDEGRALRRDWVDDGGEIDRRGGEDPDAKRFEGC